LAHNAYSRNSIVRWKRAREPDRRSIAAGFWAAGRSPVRGGGLRLIALLSSPVPYRKPVDMGRTETRYQARHRHLESSAVPPKIPGSGAACPP
jgi:hypothetical protein